jgi:hypothetical protein
MTEEKAAEIIKNFIEGKITYADLRNFLEGEEVSSWRITFGHCGATDLLVDLAGYVEDPLNGCEQERWLELDVLDDLLEDYWCQDSCSGTFTTDLSDEGIEWMLNNSYDIDESEYEELLSMNEDKRRSFLEKEGLTLSVYIKILHFKIKNADIYFFYVEE